MPIQSTFLKWFKKKHVKIAEEGVSSEIQINEENGNIGKKTDAESTVDSKEVSNFESTNKSMRIYKEKVKDFFIERTLIRILLLVVILFLLPYASYILEPVRIFITTLIMPVVISGVLFYVTAPILKMGLKYTKIPKRAIIAFIYFLLIGAAYVVISILGPSLKGQLSDFTAQLPMILKDAQNYLHKISDNSSFASVVDYLNLDSANITKSINEWLTTSIVHFSESFVSYITKISTFIIHLIVVPFMLYYMLKDGENFIPSITKFLKPSFRTETTNVLTEMNKQLNSYVLGQFAVYASVGIMVLVGYNLIGLDYAFLLSFCFVIVNFIPLVGIFIGAIPAVLVALMVSPLMALKVVIVITIAHQIDAHLISPQIMGKTLNIHPLTIIIILLVAGTFAGVIGLIFALPLYVICKVLCLNIYRIYLLHRNSNKGH